MGRRKLRLRRIEREKGRKVTYAKRRSGILKKANDLSVLCDVDVLLLMFSPSSRPTFFHSGRLGVEPVLSKLARLTPEERVRRNLGSFQVLKKTFMKKTGYEEDAPELPLPIFATCETVKVCEHRSLANICNFQGLADQVAFLRWLLTGKQKRLRCWVNVESINDVEELGQLEMSLENSFYRLLLHRMQANDHAIASDSNIRANSISWVTRSDPNFPEEANSYIF